MAYLPQCDLGVVLISAGSPLNDEDLSTIRILYESAIPVKILLSKADLLEPSDLKTVLEYTANQIRAQLGLEINPHPVSTAASHAYLLEQWFASEIAALYEKHQQLAQESIRRKTGALREAVEAALKGKLNRANNGRTPQREELLTLEHELREAAGKIEGAWEFCLRASGEIRALAPQALGEAASGLLALWSDVGANRTEPDSTVTTAITKTAGLAVQVHKHLQELARSLAAALQRTAKALGSHDAPAEEELLHPLREMPRFDPPTVSLDLRRPWILYPRTLARSRILGELRSVLGQQLSEAFATHGRLVENWARRALVELQARFDSSADGYRAQLGRLIARRVLTSGEQEAILDDLARLAQTGGNKEDETGPTMAEIHAEAEQ
jgi:hypothetical protein